MKYLIICILALIGTNSIGQTAIISNKSHSGSLSLIMNEDDNFGAVEIHPPAPVIDTVLQIDNNCMILIGREGWIERKQDTICNHQGFEHGDINETTVKAYYGEHVVYINKMKKEKPGGGNSFWINGNPHIYGINVWIALILLSIAAYILTPILRKK